MIKPIETIYKGYRFRSRLEARWAVFFDNLGLRYEYEKEGFDVNGEWYLPDFWLPDLKVWVEIKPFGIPQYDGFSSHDEFGAYNNYGPLLYSCGKTVDDLMPLFYLFCLDTCDSGGGFYENECFMYKCSKCGKINLYLEDGNFRTDRVLYYGDRNLYEEWRCNCEGDNVILKPIIDAHTKSKQARFEHGECG